MSFVIIVIPKTISAAAIRETPASALFKYTDGNYVRYVHVYTIFIIRNTRRDIVAVDEQVFVNDDKKKKTTNKRATFSRFRPLTISHPRPLAPSARRNICI